MSRRLFFLACLRFVVSECYSQSKPLHDGKNAVSHRPFHFVSACSCVPCTRKASWLDRITCPSPPLSFPLQSPCTVYLYSSHFIVVQIPFTCVMTSQRFVLLILFDPGMPFADQPINSGSNPHVVVSRLRDDRHTSRASEKHTMPCLRLSLVMPSTCTSCSWFEHQHDNFDLALSPQTIWPIYLPAQLEHSSKLLGWRPSLEHIMNLHDRSCGRTR